MQHHVGEQLQDFKLGGVKMSIDIEINIGDVNIDIDFPFSK